MTSIVYRELEATNQTDTNFDVYRNIHHGDISVPLKTLIKKKNKSRFGTKFVKSDIFDTLQ